MGIFSIGIEIDYNIEIYFLRISSATPFPAYLPTIGSKAINRIPLPSTH